MKTIAVPFVAVRAQLRDLVSRVAYGVERITITRNGSPAAALISLQDLRRLETLSEDAAASPSPVDPDESITMRADIRDVWFTLTSYGKRAGWWPGFLLDGYLDGEARIDWDKRTGLVLDCVEGEMIRIVWGWRREEPVEARTEVRMDFAVEGATVTVRVRQQGAGPSPDYWRERLAAWRDRVEGVQSTQS
ncbi:type II toxin-antitoxin system prevent-host-death family antitoxin [Rhodococcus sp. NPDC058514]|uniref:type II toxin-antitoxin system prevent-host-death family antitoxin n=1 Tax=unclassified Rhodococcus (in: high G+C Gram-positive bacteria) TaxID=192944 RepID=UPI00365177F0